MVRPTKERLERRSAQLPPVRVTEAELIAVQDQARAAGRDLSAFIRDRALTGQTVAATPPASHSLLVELSRSGNNLNQIARQLNRGRGVPPGFDMLLQEFQAVLERVGRAYGP